MVFEHRNQSLLQVVDYIERCIIGAFAPLRQGPKPPAQPLWRVLVPSARMLMPTGTWENGVATPGAGVVEFFIGDASVCNSVSMEPTLTQVIHVTAANVKAHITRAWIVQDATTHDASASSGVPLPPPRRGVTRVKAVSSHMCSFPQG